MTGARVWVMSVGLVLGGATAAVADPPPLREARSENGRFTLRVEPGRPGRGGRACEGTLLEQPGPGLRQRGVWERSLVNDADPVYAAVRNDGRFVVTLDEYRRGGARNAVVIYGPRGELLRHFLLPDLLDRADWSHVQRSRRELLWLNEARFRFDDAAEQFIIELSWGRQVRIDLRTLRVLRNDDRAEAGAIAIPAEYLSLLFGPFDAQREDEERIVGERFAGLANMTPGERAQSAAIAGELSPDGSAPGGVAAVEAPEDSASASPPPGPSAAARDATTRDAAADLSSAVPTSPLPRPVPPVPDEQPAWRAPAPDLAAKVDYVAWLNRMGQVTGPDATPLYESALARFTPWEGDPLLLSAAERGETAALTSPEIAAWLASNADALTTFRAATRLPKRGWHRNSDDGTLFGVVLPEMASLRGLARASLTDGRRLVAEGRPGEALQRYVDVSAAGAHVGQGVTLIEGVVGMAMQRQANDAALDLVRDPMGEGLDFASVADELETALCPPQPLAPAMEGERAFFMDAAQRVWDIDPQTGDRVVNRHRAREFFLYSMEDDPQKLDALTRDLEAAGFEDTVAAGNAFYDAVAMALDRPYREAAERLEQVESVAASARSNPFLRSFTPAMSRYHFIRARGEASRRAALLLANLRAYHQAHGEYPTTLDAFAAGPFVQDPFHEQPFVYQRHGDDFVLYSVGGNGTDDAGVHDAKGEVNDLRFWPPPE